MKGILIEPGRAPEPANLPDTLSAMEARLGGTVKQYIFPRTPAVLFFRTAGQPVNRVVRGQPLCGTIFCYGWRGGDIKPLSGALLAELLDRLKDTEVRVLRTTPSVPNFPTRRFMPVTVDGSGAGTAVFGKKAAS